MSSISDLVLQALSGNVAQISNKIGASEEQTKSAIGAALPTMIGALSRKTEQDGGSGLLSMLDRDGDGSVLDDLGGFLGSDRHQQPHAQGMLDGLFGAKKDRVENAVGQASGLSSNQSNMLMSMLGPLVMGAVMKKMGGRGTGGGLDLGSLVGMMQGEKESMQQNPQSSSMIGRLLDQDGDGDFDMSDMAKMASGYIGQFFSRK